MIPMSLVVTDLLGKRRSATPRVDIPNREDKSVNVQGSSMINSKESDGSTLDLSCATFTAQYYRTPCLRRL